VSPPNVFTALLPNGLMLSSDRLNIPKETLFFDVIFWST
jgi:hypothetical protein